jgi:hypothetical protein
MGDEPKAKPTPKAEPTQRPAPVVMLSSAAIPAQQPSKLSAPEALRVVRLLAADTANIVVHPHGRKHWKITRRQIELCVQKGIISEGPFVNQHGNWQLNF